jgi:hypothetical protein
MSQSLPLPIIFCPEIRLIVDPFSGPVKNRNRHSNIYF